MKKYIGFMAAAMLSVGLLTGCSSGIQLSEEENNMVAEYMAAALLRYDSQYEKELIYTEEIVEEEDKFVPVDRVEEKENIKRPVSDTEERKEDKEAEGSEESVLPEMENVSLTEVFGGKDYTISFKGIKECTTYKEEGNNYFIVEAPSGCKLVVVQFEVKNTGSKEVTVDMTDKEMVYSFATGKSQMEKPLLTALMGDLQYYKESISAGKSKMAVVLFAVDKNMDVSSGTVTVANKEQAVCRIPVK